MRGWNRPNFCNGGPGGEVPPLEDDVREEQGEDDARPDDGFAYCGAEIFPAGDASNDADLEEDDGDGEAAGHPLTVRGPSGIKK